MNVGYFKNQTFKAQDGKEAKFIGGMINIPFLRPIECGLIPTPDDELAKNQNAPIYKIVLFKPKNYEGARQIIGGIWNAVSNDGKTNYFRGHIETPLVAGGRVYLALFTPKEPNGLMFEATWSAPKKNNNSYTPQANTTIDDDVDIDADKYDNDETIPF